MTADTRSIPFVGLRAFEADDHHWFRGRDREIAVLRNRVRLNRFTAVVGASGSGKSSLVKAGILPLLEDDHWKAIIINPGSTPIRNLALKLSKAVQEGESDPFIETRLHRYDVMLRQSAYGLSEITSGLASEASQLLLIVDQFEELFRYIEEAHGLKKAAMEEESQAFVELLLTAAAHPSSRVHIVITMRSDFFGNCVAYPGLAEAVSNSQYLVPLPDRDQLETIIRSPINDAGGQIDILLVQRLLLDIAKETDTLPTLQHTLRCLWEEASGETVQLRDEDYQTIGGIEGSIHTKAENVAKMLEKKHRDHQIVLEKLFKAITLLDDQGRAMRHPQKYSELLVQINEVLKVDQQRAQTVLDEVLQAFASKENNFIQLGTSDDPEVDINHEALIRSWQRLCGKKRDFQDGWLFEERADGRKWLHLVERTKTKQLLSFLDALYMRKWIRKKKLSSKWCDRYGDSWETVLQFCNKSLILSVIWFFLIPVIVFSSFLILLSILYFAIILDN